MVFPPAVKKKAAISSQEEGSNIFLLLIGGRSESIPDFDLFFYTSTIWGQEILHLKARKFVTKVVSRQNCW